MQVLSPGGPVGQLVVTADMVPPPPEPLEAQAAHHRAIAAHLEELHQQLVAANNLREQSAQSRGFDEGHQVNRQFAANVSTAQDFHQGVATMFSAIAGVYRDVAAQQHSIVQTAQQEVAAAKTPEQVQAIIASHHAYARGVTTSGIEFATAQHGHFQAKHGADYTALVGHDGGMPQRPAPPASGPGHGRITKPVKHGKPDDGEDVPQPPGGGQAAAAGDEGSGRRGRLPERHQLPGDAPTGDAPPGTPGSLPGGPISPTQLPIRSTGFGGGSGGGGGMGGMSPGGVGGGGLGSGNPMSALSSGLGRAPSSAGGGLSSGLPAGGGAPSGMGQPSAAFAQGLSAGSAGGSVAHALPPAAASGANGAPGGSAASGVPAAGLSAGQATASGVGSSGSHFAPAVSAGSAAVGGPPAMMLPSPGMGAPAAPVSAAAPPAGAAGAPTMPAGTSGAGGGGAGSGTGSSGGAGAVVPAAVMAPGNSRASAVRIRSESPELVAAKALARQLRRDSDAAGYPIIEWVVGVFRSDTDQTTETVFMSSEGFGYIPHGVFVPRTARLLAVDPLVDNGFREKWFGWRDPSRVLVEYAHLRRPGGARLVAAAATHAIETLRTHGIEHALCARDDSAQLSVPPVLDDMHAHRLAVQCPSLYPRVTQLAACNDTAVLNQVIVPIVMQMMDGVRHGGGSVDCPQELRQMWDALGSGDEIPESAWKEFELDTNVYYAITGASADRSGDSPNDVALPGGGAVYQAQWLIARTMEVVRGWAHRPPPLADMIYAAAAAHPGDFSAKLDPLLRPLEAEAERTS